MPAMFGAFYTGVISMEKFDMKNFFKKGILDRNDGWRVKNVEPLTLVCPFILRTRLDSQNLFEDKLPIDVLEDFIRVHKDDIPGLSLMHLIIAGCVRMIALYPRVNRFVVHNKIYAHRSITCSIAIKRSLSVDGEETLIKPEFSPFDTLADVARKVNAEYESSSKPDANSNFDKTAKLISLVPAFLIRAFISLVFMLDNVGWLPKILEKVSPWHSTMFITNVGSLGINSIYHHLYEFGTTSMFVGMGKKLRTKTYDSDGNGRIEKNISLKFTLDERICDGYYYARAIRSFARLMSNPEQLLTPPDKIYMDMGVSSRIRDRENQPDCVGLA